MPDLEKGKVLCTECDWHGHKNDVERIPDPKEPGGYWTICPECRTADHIGLVCDEPGCTKGPATSGTPTPDGYRWTCYWHSPSAVERARKRNA